MRRIRCPGHPGPWGSPAGASPGRWRSARTGSRRKADLALHEEFPALRVHPRGDRLQGRGRGVGAFQGTHPREREGPVRLPTVGVIRRGRHERRLVLRVEPTLPHEHRAQFHAMDSLAGPRDRLARIDQRAERLDPARAGPPRHVDHLDHLLMDDLPARQRLPLDHPQVRPVLPHLLDGQVGLEQREQVGAESAGDRLGQRFLQACRGRRRRGLPIPGPPGPGQHEDQGGDQQRPEGFGVGRGMGSTREHVGAGNARTSGRASKVFGDPVSRPPVGITVRRSGIPLAAWPFKPDPWAGHEPIVGACRGPMGRALGAGRTPPR
jgi:hypothetical protein